MHDHASFVKKLGGPTIIASEITEMSGEPLSADNVRKWKVNGVPPKWQPHAARLAVRKDIVTPSYFFDGLDIQAAAAS